MKKVFLVSSLSLISLVLSASFAFAQSATFGQTRKEQAQERREQTKERQASKAAERKEDKVARVKARFAKIYDKFNDAMARLDKIAGKIQSRIDKLKGKGVDTSKMQADLLACSTQKTAAQAAIASAKSNVDALDPSTTSKEQAMTALQSAKSARDAIKAYHKCLVGVIEELKAARSLREGTNSAK